MVVLDRDAHLLQSKRHLGTQIVERVLGWDSVVAAVGRDDVAVLLRPIPPVCFTRLDEIAAAVHPVLVGDALEDVELELWPPQALLRHAALAQGRFGSPGDVARVIREDHLGIGLQGRADQAERRHVPEGVQEPAAQVGDQYHVASLDRLDPHRRTVETDPFLHQVRGELPSGDRQMVPPAPQVGELQVDHLHGAFGHEALCLFEGGKHIGSL